MFRIHSIAFRNFLRTPELIFLSPIPVIYYPCAAPEYVFIYI